ncbi:glycosyltransferase [Achromobacter sp.]|uniref:glycosyltransferase n=1 Tax=Achromobacter sp. TaxID=134375 RepID=UPI0031D759F2
MSVAVHSLLIVTESYEVGGLETYIAGQVRAMVAQGWAVHLACGSEPAAEFLPPGLFTLRSGLALGPDATVTDLVATVEGLRALIREKAVTHVHAHPFTSLFPAMLAAAMEGVPFVLTLHGPTSLSSGYGPVNDYLLAALVLPSANAVLAVSDEVGDLVAPYVGEGALRIQHNAVDVNRFGQPGSPVPQDAPWLAVSRLDAVKIHGIRAFVNEAHALGLGRVDIVGDGPGRATLEEWLEQDGVAHTVRFLGMRSDVESLMRSSAGVAGMGRVLLEGVACGKPVCMVGYDGVKGFVDPDLFRRGAYANFSGRNLPNAPAEDLFSQRAKATSQLADLRSTLLQYHSEDAVWSSFAKQISAFTYSAQPLVRAIYSVIRSPEAASPAAYLTSEDLFYRLGRVVHSAAYFSPQAAACYRFYEARTSALAIAGTQQQQKQEQQEQKAHQDRLAGAQQELSAMFAQAEERSSAAIERVLEQVQSCDAERKRQDEELAEAVKALESAVVGLDTRLREQKTLGQRVSGAAKNLLGRHT